MAATESKPSADFIRQIVAEDVRRGRNAGRVVTRFPPEPNGYLHIGHAKSICLNFGVAAENAGGVCHLRFDDTNPTREEPKYVQAIKEDIRWLGFDFSGHEYYASDYFQELYEYAVELIRKGKAYVCQLSAEEIRRYRGTLTEPGRDSPNRNRPIQESLDLFRRMRAGELADGAAVLRAMIDMASPNLNLRDPVMYRILKVPHQRTGGRWSIYPVYDFAHGQSDSLEGSTQRPSLPPPTMVTLIDAPDVTIDPVLLPVGGNEFERTCASCHGRGAIAAGMAPDLRASAIVLSEEAFASVVRDGILAERGMPEFADLRDRQLLAIRHYIRYSAENPPSIETGPEGN